MISRRKFLTGCSALTLGSSLVPKLLMGSLAPDPALAASQVDYAFFAARVGTTFSVLQGDSLSVKLKLISAELSAPGHSAAEDGKNEKFTLLFRGPLESQLRQNTHAFKPEAAGKFAMFIVPVKTGDASNAYYEAVFNRPAAGVLV